MMQARAEELLLDLIQEMLVRSAPEMSDFETDRGQGYNEGYWDAIERLSQIADERHDNNLYALIR